MRALAHQRVSEAVNALLTETPPIQACGSLLDLQLELIRKGGSVQQDKDLTLAAIKDAWFLGHWSLRTNTQLSDESARNLVTPASKLHDVYWRNAKHELSTATGCINPMFMDLAPNMLNVDTDSGTVTYNEHATRIIDRNLGDQANDSRIPVGETRGCPHGVIGMSRFLLQYLEFMSTNVREPVLSA